MQSSQIFKDMNLNTVDSTNRINGETEKASFKSVMVQNVDDVELNDREELENNRAFVSLLSKSEVRNR